jgi:HAD superfamily hydrolase (TIGR01549 family)
MPRWKAALLDIDGTLVDSNDAHAHAWIDALHGAGYRVSFEHVRALIGKGGDKLLPEVTGVAKDSPRGKELSDRRARIFTDQYLPHIKAFPRAGELLQRMHDGGLRLVVATSANEAEMKSLLEVTGAAHLFYRAAAGGHAPSKPDPDIIESALNKAGVAPNEAIMLGDTPYDVEASTKAGVLIVGLRSGGWPEDALRGTAAVYDSPSDLLEHYEESPFGLR